MSSADSIVASRFSNLLRRLIAWNIDLLVVGMATVPIFLWKGVGSTEFVVAFSAVAIVDFVVLEGLCGRTVGKWIAGMVVVDYRGHRPGLLRAFVRNLLRIV